MKFFDLHCDTITGLETVGKDLDYGACAVSLSKADFDAYAQCFAIFLSDEYRGEAAIEKWDRVYHCFCRQMARFPQRIEQVFSFSNLMQIIKAGKIAAILTTESAAAFAGDLKRIELLRSRGCLITSLTWNGANELAGGVYAPEVGLTGFGREAVAEMERVGMIVDISHLCDQAVDDLLKIAKRPIIATHSNSRPVCNAQRNLTDEQFQEIVRRGGLVGINFLRYFLREDDPSRADMEDILRHVEHFLALGGEDTIAFGSDYDGANIPVSFDSLEKMHSVYDYLEKQLSRSILEKLFFQNAWNFFQRNF